METAKAQTQAAGIGYATCYKTEWAISSRAAIDACYTTPARAATAEIAEVTTDVNGQQPSPPQNGSMQLNSCTQAPNAVCNITHYFGDWSQTTNFLMSERKANVLISNHDPEKSGLCFGKPIYPLTGSKSLTEELSGWALGGRRLLAVYDTRRMVPVESAPGPQASGVFPPSAVPFEWSSVPPASLGALWSTNLHKGLVFQQDGGNTVRTVQAWRGTGAWITFMKTATGYVADGDVPHRLIQISGGWLYIDAKTREQERYGVDGKLIESVTADGARLNFYYSDATTLLSVAPAPGLLITVEDQYARSVQFQYELSGGSGTPRIKQISTPSEPVVIVGYDTSGYLSNFTWLDGRNRQYLHERVDLPWAVTGIIDENDSRLATYGFDLQGRAVETQWAGGAHHFTATYGVAPTWIYSGRYDAVLNAIFVDHSWKAPQSLTITKPNGGTSNVGVTVVGGKSYFSSQSQPSGSGCAASTSHQGYDANGNVASRDDFNGTRSCYVSDLSRNLETTRVEGLNQTTDCAAVTASNASLPANSRKVSTQWHPDWRLSTQAAEPGRITTSIYNGQADPFNAGAIASCAPATALLPDGKPIVVLCKSVEQATTDTDGHLGFSASLQSGVANRVQSWTYNPYGQVLTAKGPRTDVNATTSYAYYADTTTDHTLGDLKSVTNAAGKVTSYSQYNKHGQVLQSQDPNGVVTVNTYDLRQRLLSSTVAGQTTSYSYDGVGQLKKVTLPDQSWVGYDYDDAHRQVAVYDNQGNRSEYVLDNAGNKTAENIKDPSGNLKRQLSRSIDALGRVQQTTGRE
ncbi:MAG: RHS repeat protein [Rhizobacter sp.]